ncbi:MAG: SDR family NAD(P)-dependent oxidoreductase, partial [Opitutaceae bacterium]
EEYWDQMMALNLKSAFLCVKAVWEQMVARKAGCIVNVASVSARNGGGPGAAAYAAAKGGLLAYTKGLARELSPQGVRVNGVSPGLILTPFHEGISSAEMIQKGITGIPLGRAGTAAHAAGMGSTRRPSYQQLSGGPCLGDPAASEHPNLRPIP